MAGQHGSPGPGGPTVVTKSDGPVRLGLMAIPSPDGLRVRGTVPGLPAEAAGILEGDLVREINGKPVSAYERAALGKALRALPVTLLVERSGETHEIVVGS